MKVYTMINLKNLSNIYLITDNNYKEGILIDPGVFDINIFTEIKKIGVDIKKVIITSNDIKKFGGLNVLRKIFDLEVFSKTKITDDTIIVKENDTIELGNIKCVIIELPIKKFDSICIYTEKCLFVGNIIEAGIINYNKKTELSLIKEKIFSVYDDAIIYPYSGPATTVEIEKKFNDKLLF